MNRGRPPWWVFGQFWWVCLLAAAFFWVVFLPFAAVAGVAPWWMVELAADAALLLCVITVVGFVATVLEAVTTAIGVWWRGRRTRRRAPVQLVEGRPRVGVVRVRPGGRVGGRAREG